MKQLLSALRDIPEYRALTAAVDNGGCPVAFSGLSAVHRAHFAAGLCPLSGRAKQPTAICWGCTACWTA